MTQSARKHVVKVRIGGEEYSIRSEAAPERVRAVAEHVDRTLREVLAGGLAIESHRAAILAALQITEELFKARESVTEADEAMSGLAGEVKRLLPPHKREPGAERTVD